MFTMSLKGKIEMPILNTAFKRVNKVKKALSPGLMPFLMDNVLKIKPVKKLRKTTEFGHLESVECSQTLPGALPFLSV